MAELQTEMTPVDGQISNDVPGQVRIASQTSGGKIIVTDESALNAAMNEITGKQFDLKLVKYKETIDGLDPVIANTDKGGPVYRIPTLQLDEKGVLHCSFDVRMTGWDQDPIEVGYARSKDGGKTWVKKVIGKRYSRDHGNGDGNKYLDRSRVMDPTMLHAGDGNIFILCGRWLEGANNWVGNSDSAQAWSAALLLKSTDNGDTWTQNTIGRANCTTQEGTHITVENMPSDLSGFLGGIDGGLKHSSGKLVFATQITKTSGGAFSCLLVSSDGGATWRMSSSHTDKGLYGDCYEPSILELPDGRIVLHTRSDSPLNRKSMKRAFVTDDFGETWSVYEPLNQKVGATSSGGGNNCEGGTAGFSTISGNYVCLAAYPQVESGADVGGVDDSWARNQITLYACNLNGTGSAKAIGMLNYSGGIVPTGSERGVPYGGYSSIEYKQTSDGEYCLALFEDGLGITLKNISDYIPRAEIFCTEFMPRSEGATIPPEKIEEIKNGVIAEAKPEISASVMDEVERSLSDWPSDFYCFAKTVDVEGTSCPVIGSDGNPVGTLVASGGYLNGGNINSDKLRPSELYKGLLHFTTSNADHGFRGEFNFDSSAETISILFGLYIPTQSGQSSWFPIFKLSNSATALNSWKGGLNYDYSTNKFEVMPCGTTDSLSTDVFSRDKIHSIALEYNNTSAKLYIDGVLASTKTMNQTQFDGFKSSISLALGGDGASKVFDYHAGSFGVYNRVLTDKEKKYGWMYNGDRTSKNLVDYSFEICKKINGIEGIAEEIPPLVQSSSLIPKFNLFRIDGDGRFLNDASINVSGGTWSPVAGSTTATLSLGTGTTKVTKAKTTNGLTLTVVNGHAQAETPNLPLGTLLSGVTGFSLEFKIKHETDNLPNADYSDWFGILSIKHNDSDSPVVSLCGNRNELRSRGYYDIKVLKDISNPETGYGTTSKTGSGAGNMNISNYTVNGINTYMVVLNGENAIFYCNGNRFLSLPCVIQDFSKLGGVYLDDFTCYNGNNNNKQKNTFNGIRIFKKALSDSEVANYYKVDGPERSELVPEWYEDLFNKIISLSQQP